MYKGVNPSAKRSQQWIAEALISLIYIKKIKEITVKEIMNNTELSRQTFYQLFDSVVDVLEYYIDLLFIEYLRKSKTEKINNLCDAAQFFFLFFKENESFVEALVKNNKTYLLQNKYQEYLEDEYILNFTDAGIQDSKEKYFTSAFIANGLVGMLDTWFKSDKAMSSKELADLVC